MCLSCLQRRTKETRRDQELAPPIVRTVEISAAQATSGQRRLQPAGMRKNTVIPRMLQSPLTTQSRRLVAGSPSSPTLRALGCEQCETTTPFSEAISSTVCPIVRLRATRASAAVRSNSDCTSSTDGACGVFAGIRIRTPTLWAKRSRADRRIGTTWAIRAT